MPPQVDNMIKDGSRIRLRVGRDWYWYDTAVAPLGAGAMGTVYLGRNLMDRHDLVAIKLVNPRFASSPSIRARARLEANLAFRHPNLVEMIGLCEVGNIHGPMFIISRLVQGVTIGEHIAANFSNRSDRVNKIVKLMFPVIDALDFIHEKGIVHLDIKPGNIMVENGCNVRLMDLGIAYTQGSPGISASGLLGTPGYAAPEQYIQPGQTEVAFDARTDIYQLGATLYELLSGEKPYGQGSNSADGLALIPDGEEKKLIKLDKIAGVPSRLMSVIAKALDPEPSRRYASAKEFGKALREAITHRPGLWERLFG